VAGDVNEGQVDAVRFEVREPEIDRPLSGDPDRFR
jgi:hypothetical protein